MKQGIKVSKYTLEQAKEYANIEAEIHGFKENSPKWKNAVKEYIHESYHTMAIGRNPRPGSHKYKAFVEKYPEIFALNGFAGKVAGNYRTTSGHTGIPIEEVQNRIMSAVMNIVKLFENGIMGTKTTTKGRKQGKIQNQDMSDLQMPNRNEFQSDEEFEGAKKDVVYAWFQRDILIDGVLEMLLPFLSMDSQDVDRILGAINLGETSPDEAMGAGRLGLVDALRKVVKPKVDKIRYVDLVLKP